MNLASSQLVVQTRAADLEKLGRPGPISIGILKSLANACPFRLAGGPARDGTEIVPCRIRSQRHHVLATEIGTGGGDDRPFEIVLQLPHIAGPCGTKYLTGKIHG